MNDTSCDVTGESVYFTEHDGWQRGQSRNDPNDGADTSGLVYAPTALRVQGVDNGVISIHTHTGDEKYTSIDVYRDQTPTQLTHNLPKNPFVIQ